MEEIVLFLATFIITLLCYRIGFGSKGHFNSNAPPCLPSLPIVGSIPFIGKISDFHICLTEKAQKYGQVYGLYLGSKYFVILNGNDSIREGLVKKGSSLADRELLIVDGVVSTDPGVGIVTRQYDDELRTRRQIAMSVLKKFGYGLNSEIQKTILSEAECLLQYIHSQNTVAWCPAHIFEHTTLNIIYTLMFGQRFQYEDHVGHFLLCCCQDMLEALDAVYDVFPILLWLPHVNGKLMKHRQQYIKWLDFIEQKVKESLEKGTACNNFVTEYAAEIGLENVSQRELAVIVRDLMIAGTETTSGQLNWALILLANHPEIQSKVQKEIDSAVPRSRLPSLDDKPQLPYLEATILEVMRIRTAVPLALPHRTKTDIEIKGYRIPAKTPVLINLWSAHMDKMTWVEPEVFRPERFLNEENIIVNREKVISFSLGKRSCMAELLARQEMFLFLAAIIQQFNILPPEGEDKVKDKMCFLRTLTAEPHTLRIVPR